MPLRPHLTPLLLAIAAAAYVGADTIVKQPLAGKTGPEKLLIIINGAYIENTNYQEVAAAIQEASPLKLWIAIPSFLLNCPNPGEIGGKITGAVSMVKAANFSSIDPPKDVFISGHSLGGIMSQGTVAKGGYAGLILFGSYLTSTFHNSLETFKYPVLTLAGELDGLTRITRIAHEWRGMKARVAKDGAAAAFRFPVFALPGQTHSQFCSNVNVTSFGTKDLRPETSYSDAHAAIGASVDAFMQLVLDPTNTAAQGFVSERMDYTSKLLEGFLTAQDAENQVCATAQKALAANVTRVFTVTTDQVGNSASFGATYPKVNAASSDVSVVVEVQHPSNPADNSLTDVAASEVDCKVTNEKALFEDFGQSTGTVGVQGCEASNVASISSAQSLATSATLSRYQREGKPFSVGEDIQYNTGVTWQAGAFTFASDASKINIQSPVLRSGSYVLCKLLSPSKIIEYMMVDGLPRFDGTVI